MTRFQDYFTEQIEEFNKYHCNLLVDTKKDDIHKIRTTLKKIKTFNILLDGLLFREKDFPVELSKIFKLAGEIRDIQIQQKILDDYKDDYKVYLHHIYRHKLSSFKIKHNFQEELKYLSEKLDMVEDYHIDEQIIANIEARIEIGYNEIRNLTISKENLHGTRTKIKRIYYTLLMLGKLEDADKLYNIQDKIGLWHDYDVTIQNIKHFEKHSDIIESLTKKRDSLYDESLLLLKNF